jgi:hypothetical protein
MRPLLAGGRRSGGVRPRGPGERWPHPVVARAGSELGRADPAGIFGRQVCHLVCRPRATTSHANPTNGIGFLCIPACHSWQTCETNPICGPKAPRLRIDDCGLRIGKRRPGAGAGSQMRKTNPISPGRRRLTEGIVQNEPKLGKDGSSGHKRKPDMAAVKPGRRAELASRSETGQLSSRRQQISFMLRR